MQIKSIQLIAVELKQSLRVFTESKREYAEWEVQPTFIIGLNKQNEWIQNISVEVMRTIGERHATIVVLTSLRFELASDDVIPTNDQDFLEYASLQQIAISHARALFLREARGTKFEGGIIPVDSLFHALQKIKLSVFNSNRFN